MAGDEGEREAMIAIADKLTTGAHRGVDFVDYCVDPGVNSTTLKNFHGLTPKHAKVKLDQPDEDTEAMRRGHAAHTAVLEPSKFNTSYAMFPKAKMIAANGGSANCNAYKAAKRDWYEKHDGACILADVEWDGALAIRDAILKGDNQIARDLLINNKGRNELTVIHDGEIRRKARIDRLTDYNGRPCIVDLKTIGSRGYILNPRTVEKQINKFAYHVQMAWYLDTLNLVAPAERIAIIVFVESDPPHDVVCYHIEEETIEEGRRDYQKYLAQYLKGIETGYWPGYSNRLLSFNFSDYLLNKDGE